MDPSNIKCTADILSIVSCIGNCVIGYPVVRRDHIKALGDALEELQCEAFQIQELRDIAGFDLTNWLGRVRKAVEKAMGIKEESKNIQSCMKDFSCHCYSIYSFATRAELIRKEVTELLEETRGFPRVYMEQINAVEKLGVPTPIGMEGYLEEVSTFLRKGGGGIMEISGIGGMGKTTLLQSINDRILIDPSFVGGSSKFNLVIYFNEETVANPEMMQKVIFDRLKIKWPTEENADFSKRAASIHHLLSRMSFLLLLDQLWEFPNLPSIGIPDLEAPAVSTAPSTSNQATGVLPAQIADKHATSLGTTSSTSSSPAAPTTSSDFKSAATTINHSPPLPLTSKPVPAAGEQTTRQASTTAGNLIHTKKVGGATKSSATAAFDNLQTEEASSLTNHSKSATAQSIYGLTIGLKSPSTPATTLSSGGLTIPSPVSSDHRSPTTPAPALSNGGLSTPPPTPNGSITPAVAGSPHDKSSTSTTPCNPRTFNDPPPGHNRGSKEDEEKPPKRKLIFTTRLENLYTDYKYVEKLPLKDMEEKHAWELFTKNFGDEVKKLKDAPVLVTKVFQVCAKLPPSIIRIIGNKMSKLNDDNDRLHFYNMLKRFQITEIEGLEREVYTIFGESYLRWDKTTKDCCLSCSLWPEGHSIEKKILIESWMGLGLVDENRFPDINGAYDKGSSIIRDLKQAMFLEAGDGDDGKVKMKGLFRNLALWEARLEGKEPQRWLVPESGGMAREGVQFQDWGSAQRVSRINNGRLGKLSPDNLPSCSNLTVLMLQGCHKLESILPGSLPLMNKLTHLNLSATAINTLPADIGSLNELEYLNLSYTKITSLPKKMKNLKALKYLHLECTASLSVIPPMVISSLTNLRVLNLYNSNFSDWHAEERGDGNGCDSEGSSTEPSSIEGMLATSSITSLAASEENITEPSYIEGMLAPSPITSLNLVSFSSGVRKAYGRIKNRLWKKTKQSVGSVSFLEFKELKKLIAVGITLKSASAVKFLPSQNYMKARSVYITGYDDTAVLNLSSDFLGCSGNMNDLQELTIARCGKVKELLMGSHEASQSPSQLPSLSTLNLSHLGKLERIVWNKVKAHVCLERLSVLKIDNCDELIDVTWVLRLPSTTELQISSCKKLSHVIGKLKADETEEVSSFASLKCMVLEDLPSLSSICEDEWTFPRLTELKIHGCPMLQNLPSKLKNSKLCKIEASNEWVNNLSCDEAFKSWIRGRLPSPMIHPTPFGHQDASTSTAQATPEPQGTVQAADPQPSTGTSEREQKRKGKQPMVDSQELQSSPIKKNATLRIG